MNRKIASLCSALLVGLLAAFAGTPAFASHLRGTSLSWVPTSTPGTVIFTLQYAQRASAGCDQGYPCVVGNTISDLPFYTGDTNPSGTSFFYLTGTITSVNTAQDTYSATATLTYSYATPGTYAAYYDDCCRIGTTVTGAGDNIHLETTVTPYGGFYPPVTSMPPIITVPIQNSVGFQINATDASHNTLSYRLATTQEQYDIATPSCSAEPPPGLSVNSSTGAVTWDTTQITAAGCGFAAPQPGDLWPVQFVIQALDSSNNVIAKTPLDIIVEFINSTEAPPTLTFSNPGPITVNPGSPVTFTVTGNDTAANSLVTLGAAGIPVGASSTNLNASLAPPVTSTFTWTPTQSQGGASYVVSYSATNDTYENALGSITINVTSLSPPVLACSTSLSTTYNASFSVPITVKDPQGDAVTVVWTLDGTTVHTDNVAATSSTTNLSISPTLNAGPHTVGVTATDTDNQTATCATSISVAQASQTITFTPPSPVVYGAAPITLTATDGGSGIPRTFTLVSGPATLSGSTLTITGAGSVIVSANQAGNTNYTAASTVTRTITVTQAPQTIAFTPTLSNVIYGAANITLTATASSGLAVSYSATGACSIVSGAIHITGAGSCSVTATQAGNTNYTAATPVLQSFTIAPEPLTFIAANATKIYGQANPTLTGTITGIVNNDPISATYSTTATTSSPVGTYPITVTPVGTLTNYSVTTTNGTLTITKATPVVGVTTSAASVFSLNPVTFTATVSSPVSTPTGSVTFYTGTTALATVALTNGVAVYTTTALPSGANAITAVYSGDANFLGLTSNTVAQTVVDFTIAPSGSATVTVNPGTNPTYSLVVTPVGATTFPGVITLTPTGGSSSLGLSVYPSSIPAGAGATTLTLSVVVPNKVLAKRDQPGVGRRALPITLALLFLPLLGATRKARGKLRGILAAVILITIGIAANGLTGCGTPTGYFGQQPETYTLTVTGTSGALTHSTNVTLTVE